MSRRFTASFTVQWADVDLAGVVYFPHFFRYFSETEAAFYRSLGPNLLELEESLGIRLPRVEAACRYLKPARFGEQLDVSLSIARLGAKTVRYEFDVCRGDEAIAAGHLVIASVTMADFKSIPLPQPMRQLLEPYAPPDGGS
jgi:acyl-CoA thioester hydrolase